MTEFDLIGVVGEHITGLKVSEMLNQANGDDVNFNIATYGGSLEDSKIIYNKIKAYKGKTTGTLIGDTASAGTVILMGCDARKANKLASFLIHNSSDPDGGNAKELLEKAQQLKRHDSTMVSVYMEATGLPEATIRDLMAKEDWIIPTEAQKLGFIDEVISSEYKAVAYHSNVKLSKDLLLKLENKMNLFGKKDKAKVEAHLVKLADGSQILANAKAEAIEAGVEVAPINAAALEPGKHVLEDDRTIVIDENGMITEVIEVQAAEDPEKEEVATAEVVARVVTKIVAEETAKIQADINAKLEALKTNASPHVPPKGKHVQATQAIIDIKPEKKAENAIAKFEAQVRTGIENTRKK